MKQLILNQITICADGSIGLQWKKFSSDGDELGSHRTVIDFDGTVDQQVGAVIAQTTSDGYQVIGADQIELIEAMQALAHADPRIAATRTQKIALRAAAMAEEEQAAVKSDG